MTDEVQAAKKRPKLLNYQGQWVIKAIMTTRCGNVKRRARAKRKLGTHDNTDDDNDDNDYVQHKYVNGKRRVVDTEPVKPQTKRVKYAIPPVLYERALNSLVQFKNARAGSSKPSS